MLSQMTSNQLSEWKAYEMVAGPLDRKFDQEVLAHIHEQLQLANFLSGQSFVNKDTTNPVPSPQRYPTPEMLSRRESEELVEARKKLEEEKERLKILEDVDNPDYMKTAEYRDQLAHVKELDGIVRQLSGEE